MLQQQQPKYLRLIRVMMSVNCTKSILYLGRVKAFFFLFKVEITLQALTASIPYHKTALGFASRNTTVLCIASYRRTFVVRYDYL